MAVRKHARYMCTHECRHKGDCKWSDHVQHMVSHHNARILQVFVLHSGKRKTPTISDCEYVTELVPLSCDPKDYPMFFFFKYEDHVLSPYVLRILSTADGLDKVGELHASIDTRFKSQVAVGASLCVHLLNPPNALLEWGISHMEFIAPSQQYNHVWGCELSWESSNAIGFTARFDGAAFELRKTDFLGCGAIECALHMFDVMVYTSLATVACVATFLVSAYIGGLM